MAINRTFRIAACIASAILAACSGGSTLGDSADEILAGARRAMGGVAAANVTTIHAEAVVQSPGRESANLIFSATDGRARMEQSRGFIAVIHPSGDWQLDPRTAETVPLEREVRSLLHGHELHMAALSPRSRYGEPRFRGREEFRGQPALALEFTGVFGEPVYAYYSTADTLPLGFRMTRPEPDVIATFDGWIVRDSVRLFTKAAFLQGSELFEYTYTVVELNGVPDSAFVSSRLRLER